MNQENYNGMGNYKTWTVALDITHDEELYEAALYARKLSPDSPYKGFRKYLKEYFGKNIAASKISISDIWFIDPELDTVALDKMIRELA